MKTPIARIKWVRYANRASRSITSRTWLLVQNLHPRAVGTPRSVNAAAIACGLIMPWPCISAMIGASANARPFARIIPVLRPTSAASGVACALRRGVATGPFDIVDVPCVTSRSLVAAKCPNFGHGVGDDAAPTLATRGAGLTSGRLVKIHAHKSRIGFFLSKTASQLHCGRRSDLLRPGFPLLALDKFIVAVRVR
jgi:hypothetical protein